MNKILIALLITLTSCSTQKEKNNLIPPFILGDFEDDYEITYSISDSLFLTGGQTKIHIREWNKEEQFFVGQNDSLNIYDPLLYSRIDWIEFKDMNDFKWGFCMSAYNIVSLDSAKAVNIANGDNPRTGCGGYPFSRMKRVTN